MTPERRFATDIVQRLTREGYIAYFAGGCVRDHLLNIEPHDFDIATNATPKQVRDLFGSNRTLLVGASFGVVCVHQKIDGVQYQVEVATFRTDGVYSDGRHPDDVRFSSPEEDAQRRDFTINGIFFDPMEDRVIDYVGGVEDLNHRILNAIGNPNDRFAEDKLRLMRAIRFATRFQLRLEKGTEAAIHALAPSIIVVSPERIAMEMRKLLELPQRDWGMQKLFETGLLKSIFPKLASAWEQSGHDRQDSLQLLAQFRDFDFAASIAALCLIPFHFLPRDLHLPIQGSSANETDKQGSGSTAKEGKQLAEELKQAWRLSNHEENDLRFYLESPSRLLEIHHRPWSAIQPWIADLRARRSVELLRAWGEIAKESSVPLEALQAALARPRDELDPKPIIDGADLRSLGWQPGPVFRELLTTVRALQLDGELSTKEQAMEWLRQYRKDG